MVETGPFKHFLFCTIEAFIAPLHSISRQGMRSTIKGKRLKPNEAPAMVQSHVEIRIKYQNNW